MQLICLLEEPSAKELLSIVLPKVVPEVSLSFIVFDGKSDLENQIERRLRYWLTPDTCFLVMRDKDAGDCMKIKQQLLQKIKNSGRPLDCICVRIACHELETFYLGDLKAVETGLSVVNLSKKQNQAKYRTPDNLANASEELEKLTSKKYSKIAGTRQIAPHMALDGSNKSRSFNVLIHGVKSLVHGAETGKLEHDKDKYVE